MGQNVRIITVTITDESEKRLDKALLAHLPDDVWLSRSRIGKLIRNGDVSLAGKVIRAPSHAVGIGQEWSVSETDDTPHDPVAEAIAIDIVHEDEDIIVVDKPPGMVVHPAVGNRSGTLVNAVMHHCGSNLPDIWGKNRPGVVHRLDKDTSGLIVLAKSDQAMADLARQFSDHSAGRVYIAVVRGDIARLSVRHVGRIDISETGACAYRLESRLGRDRNCWYRQAVLGRGGRIAITNIRAAGQLAGGSCSVVECRLETGRTHQIRVHMAHVGHPLVGDRVYGSGSYAIPSSIDPAMQDMVRNFPRQALHACKLSLDHPRDGRRLELDAALPGDLAGLIEALS